MLIRLEELLLAADDVHALTPALPTPEMQRVLRRAAGVPVKQLAYVMGTSVDSVFKHERGEIRGWATIAQDRRARRMFHAIYQCLLEREPDALRDALTLGSIPRRGPQPVVSAA